MSTVFFVLLVKLLVAFTFIDFKPTFFSGDTSRETAESHARDMERTIKKPFTRLIRLRRATTSQTATHQS